MNRFARLLDDLLLSPSRGGKLRLLATHFREVPDPDRGWALAALTGALDFRHATPAVVRRLAASRIDPVLLALSHDYVGDLAETVALTWPAAAEPDPPTVDEIVRALAVAARADVPGLLAGWLDRLDAAGRWALLKLLTGALRVGVSGRLARTALAGLGGVDLARIEEAWHALEPPYETLFAWIEGRGPAPSTAGPLAFRPVMLAHPLEDADHASLEPALLAAEWKWDGARIQLCGDGTATRLHSRTGDDIGTAFPEIRDGFGLRAVLDGELLAGRPGAPSSFNALQQRLNRKSPTRRLLAANPAFVRLYDILLDGEEDLRALPFAARRARLEAWHARNVAGTPRAGFLDLSGMLAFAGWDDLAALRGQAAAQGAEGLMLKRLDSPYLGGRPRGPWYKWKRDPMRVDAVLLYAQRGHGRRSSFYSDFTFGCWGAEGELVPVGKAYFGFTDEELARLDRWVRAHVVDRFGPVLVVERALVCELAFDAVQRSTRHKSGIALRFPRIERIRWDKPAAEADRVEALLALAAAGGS
ncbi:MAG: cisplatin damage response ATP-dependent DNA ligase [Alphaproteobacteria bacterium]|nr:cisplatin damage response ATP-dependent DNA ligase [Alphaproteobacteria bacterium]